MVIDLFYERLCLSQEDMISGKESRGKRADRKMFKI